MAVTVESRRVEGPRGGAAEDGARVGARGRRPPLGYAARNRRRILCVFPRYAHSFGTFDHAFPLVGVKAFMPPQGLLVIAAALPAGWEVRFVDENVEGATAGDFAWADAVFVTGMHVQRERIEGVAARAHAAGKVVVLGGPSVTASPEWYGCADILHLGEMGDATEAVVRRIDADVSRPSRQERYATRERTALEDFPAPAYGKVNLRDYFIGSVQFSSGCPFQCEFCDIPELYGRSPRLKTPAQVTAELDVMLARGGPGAVYFVDDNFIANPRAATELLRALVRWQRERGYPTYFACEATLNLAKHREVLELMREAAFTTVFCGIETPEAGALEAMGKRQNLRTPILEAVERLNSYGLEVVSGIMLGLDTDTEETGAAVRAFVEASRIPLLTINVLHALPRTPLWRRLEAAGRLREGRGRPGASNVEFLLPEATVLRMWRETVEAAYAPEAVYRRFDHQARHTFAKRKKLPVTRARLNAGNVARGMGILGRVVWRVGVRGDYRREFWPRAWRALRAGNIEEIIHIAVVSHHVITYARECARGGGEVSFYSEAGVG